MLQCAHSLPLPCTTAFMLWPLRAASNVPAGLLHTTQQRRSWAPARHSIMISQLLTQPCWCNSAHLLLSRNKCRILASKGPRRMTSCCRCGGISRKRFATCSATYPDPPGAVLESRSSGKVAGLLLAWLLFLSPATCRQMKGAECPWATKLRCLNQHHPPLQPPSLALHLLQSSTARNLISWLSRKPPSCIRRT